LQDFLGKTVEIRIIDFLSQNRSFTYNQTEISECLGVSRTSVNHKLPELIFNGMVEIKEKQGNANYYQLANNGIVKKLIGLMFENGLFVSEYDNDEETVISGIKQIVGPISYMEKCECFYYPEKIDEIDIPTYLPEFDVDNIFMNNIGYGKYEGNVPPIRERDYISNMNPNTAASA